MKYKVYYVGESYPISDEIETITELLNFIKSWEKAWDVKLLITNIANSTIYVTDIG